METILPILKEFGFPIALCAVLLWAIRAQNAQLVKAYTDRIGTLERIVKGLNDKVDELEKDRIRRSEEHGHTLKGIAIAWSKSQADVSAVIKDTLVVIRKLCDSMGSLHRAIEHYQPHPVTPRPPHAAEVPADPAKRETHPISRSEA